MNGVGLNRYFRLMKEWTDQNPGKRVGVSAQRKIMETMTQNHGTTEISFGGFGGTEPKESMSKYSEKDKREERKIQALEKICTVLVVIAQELNRMNENHIIEMDDKRLK